MRPAIASHLKTDLDLTQSSADHFLIHYACLLCGLVFDVAKSNEKRGAKSEELEREREREGGNKCGANLASALAPPERAVWPEDADQANVGPPPNRKTRRTAEPSLKSAYDLASN